MKKLRFLSLCIAVLLLCTGCSVKPQQTGSTAGSTVSEDPVLTEQCVDFVVEVEAGSDPVILHLTDPQIIDAAQKRTPDRLGAAADEYWATDKVEQRCYGYIRETIEQTSPDLILLTGDLVYGEFDDSGTALCSFIAFMDSFRIPWAPIFGNHDNESNMGADWQCAQLENSEYCLFKQRQLTGNGNYTVGISQGGVLTRVFFMLDSNGCSAASEASLANQHTKTTIGFGNDQIDWYTQTALQIRENHPQAKLSFAFHIQPAIFRTAFEKYGFVNDDAEMLLNPIDISAHPEKTDGDFGYLGRCLKDPWDANNRVWKSMVALGVDSVFVGHEHCNNASVVYKGVRLQYGMKSSTYDRANFRNPDGTIVGTSLGDADGSREPLVGGTVIPLSSSDGSILQPYIYICANVDTKQ